MNSFKFVDKALEYEVKRQTEVLESGSRVTKETRGWDEKNNVTISQRTKEESTDYRYFPEPDLPPIVLTDAEIARWKAELVQLPAELRQTAIATNLPYGRVIELQEADQLTEFVRLMHDHAKLDSVLLANWIGKTWSNPDQLVDFVQVVKEEKLSNSEAMQLYELVEEHKSTPRELINKIEKIDEGAVSVAVQAVIEEHAETVAQYKAGEIKVVGFLIGQVMAKLGGKGDPIVVKTILEKRLTE